MNAGDAYPPAFFLWKGERSMSQVEVLGFRNGAYSAWHRAASLRRFVATDEEARLLSMVDLDGHMWIEYGDHGRVPLLLMETAIDTGQDIKPATVLRNFAEMSRLHAFVVLTTLSDRRNPTDRRQRDIETFRVRQVWPKETRWWVMAPTEYCRTLMRLRRESAIRVAADRIAAEAQRRKLDSLAGPGGLRVTASGTAKAPTSLLREYPAARLPDVSAANLHRNHPEPQSRQTRV